MIYDDFGAAWWTFLWLAFALAVVMGAVVNKTNFCTMGAVSDWVNIGDTGRLRSWLFAATTALIGVLILETLGAIDLSSTFPQYRDDTFGWGNHLIGGILFGIGMTLASGCGQKTLIRIGGGNLKSVLVLLVAGTFAYFMMFPFPGSDQTLTSLAFSPWINGLAVDLGRREDLGSLFWSQDPVFGRLVIGSILAVILLAVAFKSNDFRGSFDNILGGLVVGSAVVGAWYFTSNIVVRADFFGEQQIVSLDEYVANWSMYQDDGGMLGMGDESSSNAEAQKLVKPERSAFVQTQSYTFINPMAVSLRYATKGFEQPFLVFGVMALAGVILGSFVWAVVSRNFRIEWFVSLGDFVKHFIGAILMGVGGVLGLGCTIGQAVTGFSTLALGSFLTFASIVLGSALTMKVQYYKMVYEDANVFDALLSSLVDMRMLPKGLRRLEAI